MPDGENTPPQPTASGTLDDAGSTREIRSFARPPNLVGQESAGHSDPLPSLLARLSEPPQAPTRSRMDGTGSRPLLERTAGPYAPIPSLLARFSVPPQVPARLENDEADSRLLSRDFRQASHHGSMPSPRSSRNSSLAHGYRAKRKTPPSSSTTPKSAKQNRTLAERLTSPSEAQPLDRLEPGRNGSETMTTTQNQNQRVRTTPQPRNDDSRSPKCLG